MKSQEGEGISDATGSLPRRWRLPVRGSTVFLRETFSVLAAILLAFGLDSWWGARTAQNDVRAGLETLVGELGNLELELNAAIRINQGLHRSSSRLLELDPASIAHFPPDSAYLFRSSRRYWIFEPSGVAITAVISDRILDHVDAALRIQILNLPLLMDHAENYATRLDFWANRYRDRMNTLGATEAVRALEGDHPERATMNLESLGRNVLRDPELRGHLVSLFEERDHYIIFLQEILNLLVEVRASVLEELGRL